MLKNSRPAGSLASFPKLSRVTALCILPRIVIVSIGFFCFVKVCVLDDKKGKVATNGDGFDRNSEDHHSELRTHSNFHFDCNRTESSLTYFEFVRGQLEYTDKYTDILVLSLHLESRALTDGGKLQLRHPKACKLSEALSIYFRLVENDMD